jgi:hypothetical protein
LLAHAASGYTGGIRADKRKRLTREDEPGQKRQKGLEIPVLKQEEYIVGLL